MRVNMTKQQFVARVLQDQAARKDFEAENRCSELERLGRITAQEKEFRGYLYRSRGRRRR